MLAADITGDSSDLPLEPPEEEDEGTGVPRTHNTLRTVTAAPLFYFQPSILSPEHRIKHSPWFCHLVNLLTADVD